jgi:hypothetical protein
MIANDIQTEHLLTLGKALECYPEATWSTDERGIDPWTTNEIMTGACSAPVLDFDQPVLCIDRAIFPAIARKQEDVLPLLIMMDETPDAANLESLLVHSYYLWLDLNGVCWHPEVLRQQLTLEQRATEIYAIENLHRDSIDGGFEIVVGAAEAILFTLVDSLAHAQDAHAAVGRLGIGATVVAASAMHLARGGQHNHAMASSDLVVAARRTHCSDILAIQQRLPSSGCVRMADRDDIPFWPIHGV